MDMLAHNHADEVPGRLRLGILSDGGAGAAISPLVRSALIAGLEVHVLGVAAFGLDDEVAAAGTLVHHPALLLDPALVLNEDADLPTLDYVLLVADRQADIEHEAALGRLLAGTGARLVIIQPALSLRAGWGQEALRRLASTGALILAPTRAACVCARTLFHAGQGMAWLEQWSPPGNGARQVASEAAAVQLREILQRNLERVEPRAPQPWQVAITSSRPRRRGKAAELPPPFPPVPLGAVWTGQGALAVRLLVGTERPTESVRAASARSPILAIEHRPADIIDGHATIEIDLLLEPRALRVPVALELLDGMAKPVKGVTITVLEADAAARGAGDLSVPIDGAPDLAASATVQPPSVASPKSRAAAASAEMLSADLGPDGSAVVVLRLDTTFQPAGLALASPAPASAAPASAAIELLGVSIDPHLLAPRHWRSTCILALAAWPETDRLELVAHSAGRKRSRKALDLELSEPRLPASWMRTSLVGLAIEEEGDGVTLTLRDDSREPILWLRAIEDGTFGEPLAFVERTLELPLRAQDGALPAPAMLARAADGRLGLLHGLPLMQSSQQQWPDEVRLASLQREQVGAALGRRVVVWSRMPQRGYSGGRYHAWILAEALAHRDFEVTIVTDHEPIFANDFVLYPRHASLRLVLVESFAEVPPELHADLLLVVPGMDRSKELYVGALDAARRWNAHLALLNFETPNWFNALVAERREEKLWAFWHGISQFCSLILSTTDESARYARAFYERQYRHGIQRQAYAAINVLAAEAATAMPRERRIIYLVARAKYAEHKGWQQLTSLIGPAMAGHTLVLMCGSDALPLPLRQELRALAFAHGVGVEYLDRLSDQEKFAEYRRASLLLFPSMFEGYGYPPIEALYSGTPCVAFDLPVLRETCGNRLIYVPSGDFAAFQEAVARTLLLGAELGWRDRWRAMQVAGFEVYAERLEAIVRETLALPSCWRSIEPASRSGSVPDRAVGEVLDPVLEMSAAMHRGIEEQDPDRPVDESRHQHRRRAVRGLILALGQIGTQEWQAMIPSASRRRVLFCLPRKPTLRIRQGERLVHEAIRHYLDLGYGVDIVCLDMIEPRQWLCDRHMRVRLLALGGHAGEQDADQAGDRSDMASLLQVAVRRYDYAAVFIASPELADIAAPLRRMANRPWLVVVTDGMDIGEIPAGGIADIMLLPVPAQAEPNTGLQAGLPSGASQSQLDDPVPEPLQHGLRMMRVTLDGFAACRELNVGAANIATRMAVIALADDDVCRAAVRRFLQRYAAAINGACSRMITIVGPGAAKLDQTGLPVRVIGDINDSIVLHAVERSSLMIVADAPLETANCAWYRTVAGNIGLPVLDLDTLDGDAAGDRHLASRVLAVLDDAEGWIERHKALLDIAFARQAGPSPFAEVDACLGIAHVAPRLAARVDGLRPLLARSERELDAARVRGRDLLRTFRDDPAGLVALWSMARDLLERDEMEGAWLILQRAVRAFPDNVALRRQLAASALAIGDDESCLAQIQALQARFPLDGHPYLLLSRLLAARGERAAAIDAARQGLLLAPDDAELAAELAVQAQLADRRDEASSAFLQLEGSIVDLHGLRLDPPRRLILEELDKSLEPCP